MPRNRSLLNTCLFLLAFAVVTGRVLLPFNQPPLQVHADGTLEVCRWQTSAERLVFSAEGEPLGSKPGASPCPACVLSAAFIHSASPELHLNLAWTDQDRDFPTLQEPTPAFTPFLARAPPQPAFIQPLS